MRVCFKISTLHSALINTAIAMDFREAVGGEQKIQDYCHQVARNGGKKMAEVLSTKLMDEEDQFTACMVRLFHNNPPSERPD